MKFGQEREKNTSEILSKTLSSIKGFFTLRLPFVLFLSKILREDRVDREKKEKRKKKIESERKEKKRKDSRG